MTVVLNIAGLLFAARQIQLVQRDAASAELEAQRSRVEEGFRTIHDELQPMLDDRGGSMSVRNPSLTVERVAGEILHALERTRERSPVMFFSLVDCLLRNSSYADAMGVLLDIELLDLSDEQRCTLLHMKAVALAGSGDLAASEAVMRSGESEYRSFPSAARVANLRLDALMQITQICLEKGDLDRARTFRRMMEEPWSDLSWRIPPESMQGSFGGALPFGSPPNTPLSYIDGMIKRRSKQLEKSPSEVISK